jgi:hypothetical protein
MSALIDIAGLFIQYAFLAIAMSAVGIGAYRFLRMIAVTRHQSKMDSEALIARARGRANARNQAIA